MRYQVPQNIDMEDKIIGPLTMAQFLYVMIGGMAIYSAFISFGQSAPFLFWLIAIPLGLVTLAFAFLKVQDQPFPKFLASMLLYMVKPKSRIWQKDPAFQHVNVVTKQASTPEQKSPVQQLIGRSELGQLATVLDAGGRPTSGFGEPTTISAQQTSGMPTNKDATAPKPPATYANPMTGIKSAPGTRTPLQTSPGTADQTRSAMERIASTPLPPTNPMGGS